MLKRERNLETKYSFATKKYSTRQSDFAVVRFNCRTHRGAEEIQSASYSEKVGFFILNISGLRAQNGELLH